MPRLQRAAARAAVYVGGYVVLALGPHSPALLLLSFLLAGVGIGFAETAGSTTVAQLLPDHLRGNGFGVLGVVQAGGDLGSLAVVRILWGGRVARRRICLRRQMDGRRRVASIPPTSNPTLTPVQ